MPVFRSRMRLNKFSLFDLCTLKQILQLLKPTKIQKNITKGNFIGKNYNMLNGKIHSKYPLNRFFLTISEITNSRFANKSFPSGTTAWTTVKTIIERIDGSAKISQTQQVIDVKTEYGRKKRNRKIMQKILVKSE